jgi:hypothetical protein
MKLSLLPLKADALLRVRCNGPLTDLGPLDPFLEFLGGHCYGRSVLLSMDRVHAIDTSGVSWLTRSHRAFQEAGGRLVLFGLPPLLTKMLTFLRVLPVLNVAADERTASAMVLGPRLLTLPKDADTLAADSSRPQLRPAG